MDKRSLGAKILLYPPPVWVIGSYKKDGTPNAMTASWTGICCSKPPCVNVSLRKATATHGFITERRAFTVNIPSEQLMREADYLGIATGAKVDKFAAAGLTAVRAEHVDAPYIQEFPVVVECRLVHTFELGLHTLFVGEIVDVKVDPSVLDDEGKIKMESVRPFVFSPELHRYYPLGAPLGDAFSIGLMIGTKNT